MTVPQRSETTTSARAEAAAHTAPRASGARTATAASADGSADAATRAVADSSPVASAARPTCANIAAFLPALARERPYQLAVVCPQGRDRAGRASYSHLTYQQLDDESDRLARGLLAIGVGRGTRVVLMVRPGLDFFSLVFALFRIGAVMIGVDPGLGRANLGRALAEAQPEAFIGIALAHWARRLLGWGRGSLRQTVLVGPRWQAPGVDFDLPRLRRLAATRRPGVNTDEAPSGTLAATTAADPAAILFTSGSTGIPKGATYSHGNFLAQVEALRATYDIQPGEVDLATFPLFALFAPALGMTAVVPQMDFTRPGRVDPRRIAEPVADFGVTNMFGSPALLDRVSRWAAAGGHRLPSLRRVVSAGAPVPARVIERVTQMLAPGAQVYTPYGATESLPVASIGSDEILGDTAAATARGAGVCVGRAVGETDVRVIRIDDGPIPHWSDELEVPRGTVGEVVVRGPVVTAAYYNRPDLTALAKIATADGGFYHRMGDLGYFDEAGRIWFCGRKSQRVVTAAGEHYTIPCEAVFNTHPQVRRTALVGVTRRGTVEPVLCVELEAGVGRGRHAEICRELQELAARHAHTRAIRTVLVHKGFPVDIRHNAKIGREALARWAAHKLR